MLTKTERQDMAASLVALAGPGLHSRSVISKYDVNGNRINGRVPLDGSGRLRDDLTIYLVNAGLASLWRSRWGTCAIFISAYDDEGLRDQVARMAARDGNA